MRIATACLLLAVALPFAAPLARAGELIVTPDLEHAFRLGLDFLVQTQHGNGSWEQNPGITGLAVMSFLAHGELPDEGRYGPAITRAVDFMVRSQQSNGLLGRHGMYVHGFATLALAEVYGVIRDDRVGPALKRATDLIVTTQNAMGGWRYSVGSLDADTTVSGAQMLALRAAANAGMEVPIQTIQRGVAYYKGCFCAGGGFGYTGASGPNQPRAAIGLLILSLSGEYRSPEVKATADWLFAQGFGNQSYFYYKCYYCSQAMFQAGGKYWERWNTTVTPLLISMQAPNGSWPSSRITVDTSFALLSLAINYNFLPIYQR